MKTRLFAAAFSSAASRRRGPASPQHGVGARDVLGLSLEGTWSGFGLAALLLLVVPSAQADELGHRPGAPALPNLDRRLERKEAGGEIAPAAVGQIQARAQAENALRARLPGAIVERHAVTRSPKWLAARDGFLTGKNGLGRGAAANPGGAARAGLRADDPHRVAKGFVNEHEALFGHDATALERAKIRRDYVTEHSGLRTTVWQQEHEGLEVFGAVFVAHTTKDQELVNVASQFVPDGARVAVAPGAGIAPAAVGTEPAIAAERAVQLAALSLGQAGSEDEPLTALDQPAGVERKQRFGGGVLVGEALARLLWLPVNEGEMRLCWRVLLKTRDSQARYRVLIDANTGELWVRHNMTTDLTDATYRVFTSDSPTPFSPGYPAPGNTNQPAQVSRQLVTLKALNTNASPNGWIDDGVNETRGNNIDAHTDVNADDAPDLPRPQGSPNRVFDFPLDLTQAPSTYREAAVVNLFYWCNWMHDKLWELGFTEAAGNFQNNNFGRGGVGGDAVRAQAQDGSGFNNANFSYTDADGENCDLQMFLWNGPTPDRDGDFEMEVILHEYTHGLSQRLVGGGVGLDEFQSRAMGEGWSDFYGLTLLSQSGDDLDGVYARGAYSRYFISPGFMENYYYGCRFYPYSTDLTKNPLTFNDLDSAQRDLPPEVPSHPSQSSYGDLHDYGSMWAVTLWDARVNLIKKHGFATGNQLILQLVTDGMKLSPPNPNYIQARDAILQADQVLTGGANQLQLWRAFAKRGLGREASSPASSTTVGVVENFDSLDNLRVITPINLTITGPAGGPFDLTPKTFTLENEGSSALNWSVLLEAPLEASPISGTLAAGATRTVNVTLDANAAAFFPIGVHSLDLTFSNHVSHEVSRRTIKLTVVDDAEPFYERFSVANQFDLDFQRLTFTPEGDSNYHVCRDSVSGFSVPTNSATPLVIDDDDYLKVELAAGQRVRLFGHNYSSVYVQHDGLLTMTLPPAALGWTLADHFLRPGVAGLLTDLTTNTPGRILYEQKADRFVVTWDRMVSPGLRTNSFQVELFFDGVVRITFLNVDNIDGITGLSRGLASADEGVAADFRALTDCDIPPLRLTLPAVVREGASLRAGAGSVSIPRERTVPTLVSLSSSDTSELTVPAVVTIPARQTNAVFDVTLPDDFGRDGSQLVYVNASALNYLPALARVRVDDNENNPLTVVLPLLAPESQGDFFGTVRVPSTVSGVVTVSLESSHTNEIAVPPVVFIPAGQTSVVFKATVIDDRRIDGNLTTTITATVPNWTAGVDSMLIVDNEDRLLHLVAPLFITEGAGTLTNAGNVYLSGTLETNLTVSLWSSNFFALLPLGPVTIPAGKTNANFSIGVGDNADLEGIRIVQMAATAPPFSNGLWGVFLLDNDQPPEPSNPYPPHDAVDWPLETHLAWDAAEGELIVNGGFESGDFTGWTVDGFGGGGWVLNDGTFDPDSADPARPALAGGFSALSVQNGNGRHTLAQEIFIPDGATSGTLLRWRQEIRNHAGVFTEHQRFAVELRDATTDGLLSTLYATAPGDSAFGGPTNHSVGLAAWRGQRVRIAFVEEDSVGDLNVHLDDVSVVATSAALTTYDVYFGNDTVPDATEYVGSTTNAHWDLPGLAGGLYYYWRVESRRGGVTNAGPNWRFRTAGSSVASVPMAFGSSWKYVATGANLGTSWRGTNYDDRVWPTGTAPLGFGSSQVTTIGAASNDVTTFYFRRRLTVLDTNRLATVTASLKRDDGAIVYINGVEAFRDNMPAGRLDYLTQASSIVNGADETNSFVHSVDPSLFVEGTNVIAVEVHQRDNGLPFPGPSPDLFFDLAFTFRTNSGNLAPWAVNWIQPEDFAVVRTPTNLSLRVGVVDDNLLGARVTFLADNKPLAEDFITPFQVFWTNPPIGLHVLTAVATDAGGLVRTSSPIHVLVAPVPGQSLLTLIPAGSNWRYRQNGEEPDRNWTSLSYREPRDRSWLEGPAQLGYGDGDEATQFDFGFIRGLETLERPISAYFRHSFVAGANLDSLTLRVLRDDGVAVYLNGAEVWRNNLPAGVLRSNTLAVAAINPPNENTWLVTNLPPAWLQIGPNLAAAEVHQSSASSGDLSFDLELSGTGNFLPVVHLTSPAANEARLSPVNVELSAEASDPYGAVAKVQFRDTGIVLGEDSTAPYGFTWNNPAPGAHVLTAVAIDNLGGATTSAPVTLTIVSAVGLTARALATNVVELSWPETAVGYRVETTASLIAPVVWVPVNGAVTQSGGFFRVLINPEDAERYFRLRAP